MYWLRYLTGRPAAEADVTPAVRTAPNPQAVREGLVVIDVRTEREFRGGAVQGAVSLPLGRLADDIRRVAPNVETPMVLYCATGTRSGIGCTLLQGMGYRCVDNAGGVFAAAARLNRSVC